MAKGLPGADSSVPVTSSLISLAHNFFGEPPRFWGRYFKFPGSTGPAVYRPAIENPVMSANNLRVLPIAQQTNHVSADRATGLSDGAVNAAAIIEAFEADVIASQG